MQQPQLPHNLQKIVIITYCGIWSLTFYLIPFKYQGYIFTTINILMIFFFAYKAIMAFRQHLTKAMYYNLGGVLLMLLISYATYLLSVR